jgi:cytoskeleton-associated protein 5
LLKLLSDSNPNPQEKSLEILSLFLKNEPNLVSPYLGGILKILIEKNISGSKQSAKDSAKALVTGLFKLDRAQVTGVLIKYLDHKTPKMVSAAIVSFTVVLENLSFKVLDLNLVTSQMAKTSEHTNPQIRSESLNWFKELYKQIQSGIEPFLSKLKKPQQEELRKLFTTIEVLPSTGIDCSEMLESRDIFQKFNEKWTETVLSLEKWTEKKQALEELNTAADYPKLSEKSASYLVAMCKRLLNDSNIHVVSQSIKLLGLLAKGQKRFFESFAKMMAPVLFLKFRDKNKIIIQETHLALENFLFAVSLDQLLPMLESSLNDKTIPVKLQTLTFINKVFRKASKEGIRELFMLLIIISDDSNDTVREACFNVLAVFVNEFLELLSLLSELPEVKKKKVNFIRNQLTSAGQNKENLNVEVKVKNFETVLGC